MSIINALVDKCARGVVSDVGLRVTTTLKLVIGLSEHGGLDGLDHDSASSLPIWWLNRAFDVFVSI